MRSWKTWGLALFIVAVVAFLAFRWYAANGLDAAKARIHEAGYPVNYAELNAFYKEPPSGENRAYLLSFAMDAEVAVNPRILEKLPIAGNADLPHRSQPIPEEQTAAMRGYFLQNLDAVEAVFNSFQYDQCRFPVDTNAGPAMELSHLARLRSLARILSIGSVLNAVSGDTANAAKYVEGMFELAESLATEPVLISQLVRVAIDGMALAALEQAMNRADFTADELAQLQNKLAEVEANPAFVNGFIGERCIWSYLDRLGLGNNAFSSLFDGPDLQDLWISLFYRPSGLMDREGERYYRMFEQLIEALALPVEQQRERAAAIEDDVMRNGGFGPISAMVMPGIANSNDADVRNRAQLRIAVVALAAARYRAEHGAYPDTANDLVPQYLHAIPSDPYGGAPVRYRTLQNGFVAYSLAENLRDDGGAESEKLNEALREGDLTFTVERPDDETESPN